MTAATIIEIILISIGLAMDALAVSITSGSIMQKMHLRHMFRIALFFGAFQAIMPIIGWLGGTLFTDYIKNVDHWIAFGLLAFIGSKMIKEALSENEDERFDPLNVYILFTLAVATSIDALAVGITFSVLSITIWTSATIIGVITFFISFIGVFVGKKLGDTLGSKMEIIGGIILISIGTKILIEHTLL